MAKYGIPFTLVLILATFLTIPATGEEVTLQVSFRAAGDYYQTVLDKFMEDNPGVKIEMVPQMNLDQLIVQIAAGVAPDLANISWADLYDLARHDVIIPLDGYMTNTIWGRQLKSKMTPAALQQCTIGGVQYGVPLQAGANVPIYNVDLFNRRGLAYPAENWTWSDVEQLVRKLTVPEETFGIGDMTYITYWSAVMFSHGGNFFNDTLTEFTFNTEATREAFRFIMETKRLNATAPTMNSNGFLKGNVGMMYANTSWPSQIEKAGTELEWRLAVPPLGWVKRSVPGGNHPLVIINKTQHADLAWSLIEALTSDEAQLGLVNAGRGLPANMSVARYIQDPILRWFALMLEYQTPYASKYYTHLTGIMKDYIGQMARMEIPPDMAINEIQRMGSALIKEMDEKLVHRALAK